MATLITEIKTPNFQMSLAGAGEVVTDGDDILQCVHLIFSLPYGIIPYTKSGSYAYRYIDKPINKVVPGVVYECYERIQQEPRVRLDSVGVTYVNFQPVFKLNMTVIASSKKIAYTLTLPK